MDKCNPPDDFLPESYTCFFLLKMPRYTCKKVLREKLKYAIHFCKSIGKSILCTIIQTRKMPHCHKMCTKFSTNSNIQIWLTLRLRLLLLHSRIPLKSFMAGFHAKQKAIHDIFQILTTTPVWLCRWRDRSRVPEVGVPPPGVTSPATRAW